MQNGLLMQLLLDLLLLYQPRVLFESWNLQAAHALTEFHDVLDHLFEENAVLSGADLFHLNSKIEIGDVPSHQMELVAVLEFQFGIVT